MFIPDLHLISERRARDFRFATNATDLLTSVVEALTDLRSNRQEGETVAVYQLGDFLDLWRETANPKKRLDAAARIKDDHEDLVAAILDPALKTRFLLGNHDIDLYQWPGYLAWERRFYLPDETVTSPALIVLHGDIFDWLERFAPDVVQAVLVYLVAPHLSPNDFALGEMKELVRRSHGDRTYTTFIQNRTPATIGNLGASDGAGGLPDVWNVQREGVAPEANLKFLATAAQTCADANDTYGLALRTVVIGHTHHARIAVREGADGSLFTLIDGGAWIEDCVSSDGTRMPNAQIAALCGNDARIYQLTPFEDG